MELVREGFCCLTTHVCQAESEGHERYFNHDSHWKEEYGRGHQQFSAGAADIRDHRQERRLERRLKESLKHQHV